MSETPLPSPEELMLPVLRAVKQLGGEGHVDDINPVAVDIADIAEVKMAIEFPPESAQSGSKVYYRCAWARTMLKKIGALESLGGGMWRLTEHGDEYLGLPEQEATLKMVDDYKAGGSPKEPSGELLEQLEREAASGSPRRLSVRELIAMWGEPRRWASVNDRIQESLANHGLKTEPDFTEVGLDQKVAVVALEADATDAREVDATLRIGSLPSATGGVVGIKPQEDLLKAQTVMLANDYSQLAVMTGKHSLSGAVSWESIARARLTKPDAELRDCVVEPVVIARHTPFLDAVPRVVDSEFVFIRDDDKSICGIVTTSDLSYQFGALAAPFLILGEIERLFRIALGRRFSRDELAEVVRPDDDRMVSGAHDLTLGEIQVLIEEPTRWTRLNWPLERKVFISLFDEVRTIRNEVMHFSPDPVDEKKLEKLENFRAMLRTVVT